MRSIRFAPLILSLFVLAGYETACGQSQVGSAQVLTTPPAVPREFRGVWVASVQNIDWPSQPGLSTQEQKDELLGILDRAVALRLNAIILQVRPAADALYASPYEPWSEYLTGRMGQAPNPWYDPLEFAVNEAHKRGLELHAWFNPYRAHHPSGRSRPSANHISVTHPELVKKYGSMLWMDPGEPEVRAQTVRVILDVVQRYDIDGVHIDDYFYPYLEEATITRVVRHGRRRRRITRHVTLRFNDDASWKR
ncbi:MAG TPA: family 10 glycosylhydrolase, partial [Gemmatimonadaceae bacterium]|nr:family 10 glycosylhydrolase [Gemmatimonadaceae bacterium]